MHRVLDIQLTVHDDAPAAEAGLVALAHGSCASSNDTPLYRSLGYEVTHELHGFAPGIVKYLMVRKVD